MQLPAQKYFTDERCFFSKRKQITKRSWKKKIFSKKREQNSAHNQIGPPYIRNVTDYQNQLFLAMANPRYSRLCSSTPLNPN